MKTRIICFYVFLMGIMLSACAIQDVELVKVNNFNVSKSTGDQPQLRVNITLDNPNNFNIKVKKTKINLDINGNDGGEIKLAEKVKIYKKSQQEYDFVLEGDKDQILSAIKSAGINVLLTGKVNISIKGWVKGKAFGLGKKIDVNEKKSLSLKDLGIEF